MTRISRLPCTPASRSSRARRAWARISSISGSAALAGWPLDPSLSSSSRVPTTTVTGEDDQFRADAQECSESSVSPRTREYTTSASSRASHAPRASAVRA